MLKPITSTKKMIKTMRYLVLVMFAMTITACTDNSQEASSTAPTNATVETEAVSSLALETTKQLEAPLTAAQAMQKDIDLSALQHGFEYSDLTGTMRNASEWDGKVLLVNFWATWCVPCLKEMPVFSALQDKYADQGFEVIGIAADELDNINEFLVKTPVSYPILYGEGDAVFATSAQYGNKVSVLPHTAFIGRDGTVVHSKIGELHFEEAEELLLGML